MAASLTDHSHPKSRKHKLTLDCDRPMKRKNGVVAGIAPRSTRAKDGAAGAEQTTDDEVRQSSPSFVRPSIALAFFFFASIRPLCP